MLGLGGQGVWDLRLRLRAGTISTVYGIEKENDDSLDQNADCDEREKKVGGDGYGPWQPAGVWAGGLGKDSIKPRLLSWSIGRARQSVLLRRKGEQRREGLIPKVCDEKA